MVRLVEVATTQLPTTYRVVVGELAIEVNDGFRDDTLARLLAVARLC